MRNKQLTFDEQRKLQLDILDEVDACCRDNNLRYSLAFGTLIGAIRHKGYIPWDDDLDIMMPYDDMLKLRNCLHSDYLFFHDVDTDPSYGNAFANICSSKTYRQSGFGKERGLGIDVYPIVNLPLNIDQEEQYFSRFSILQERRYRLLRIRSLLFKYFSIKTFPGYSNSMIEYRNHLVSYNNDNSKRYYIIAGPLNRRNALTYDIDLFSKLIDVEFEGGYYKAIEQYDFYLRQTYGDYMQLPPEDKRKPVHGQKYYWK